MSKLVDSLIELEDRAQELETLMHAFDGLAGDDTPSWMLVVWQRVRALNAALEPVSQLARVQP
jgi:hypothetical protein